MRQRVEKFALTLHPEKTRLIEFGRYAANNRRRRGLGKPETFNFLGFTLICAQSRRGHFQIRRKTRRDRMRARLKEIREGLRERRHHPIPEQGRWLEQVVRGFFNYHAVPTNMRALEAFRTYVVRHWQAALKMRSHRDKTTYDRIATIAEEWLPKPKILHPWPDVRFAAKHPRWEPDAGKLHVRICAGGAQ
jgi:RNA-directed DNA polymerase